MKNNHVAIDGTNDEHLHVKTPLIESPKLSKLTGRQILLKLDNLQPGGSFKIRGIGHLVQFGKANGKLSAGNTWMFFIFKIHNMA